MDPDRQADIAALDSTLTTVERVLDVEGLRVRIEKLEHEASDPNLWDDPDESDGWTGHHPGSAQVAEQGYEPESAGEFDYLTSV